jgi:CPA2 family monovalent cation:H+ antiporter-2
MSSTAIVMKLLTEKLELESEHGRRITSILLFQDLAVVPLIIVLPSLAHPGPDLIEDLVIAGIKACFVLFLLLFLGQILLRRWFQIVVQRRSHELFMLNLLLVTLGAAWIRRICRGHVDF